jgi:hypothetical protein
MKRREFITTLGLAATVQDPKKNIGVEGTMSLGDLEKKFSYEPKEDITAYELALLLPLFSGTSYGHSGYGAPEGRIVPARERVPGRVAGRTVLSLSGPEQERLGTAVRHLRNLPASQ